MTINLSEVTFDYDFFTSTMPDGNLLILNRVSEDFFIDNEEVKIKGINIVVSLSDIDTAVLCSSVIGIDNGYFILTTKYKEYLGKPLTEDNMQYCTIELPEAEE
jgi:hypothetical protein